MTDVKTDPAEDLVERVAEPIYRAHGFDPAGKTVNARGEPYGDWAKAVFGAKAALSAIRPGDRLPGGLVVVPEEPAEEMVKAGVTAGFKLHDYAGAPAWIRAAYRAMLAALTEKGERT